MGSFLEDEPIWETLTNHQPATFLMSKPIAPATGIAFAFPDICKTPTPGGPVPIPYPNIAQLDQAQNVADQLLIGPSSYKALLVDSEVPTSSGDEAGSVGGVKSNGIKGACKITQGSGSVVYGPGKKGIARFGDTTDQNIVGGVANATGMVLSAFPTVLVGD